MKAMLPREYNRKGNSIEQITQQAKKIQDDMEAATAQLEEKEYTATSGGGAVKAITTGKLEVKSLEIDPSVVDKDDIDMLSDMIIAAVNESIRLATAEKDSVMEELSSGLNLPGLF